MFILRRVLRGGRALAQTRTTCFPINTLVEILVLEDKDQSTVAAHVTYRRGGTEHLFELLSCFWRAMMKINAHLQDAIYV